MEEQDWGISHRAHTIQLFRKDGAYRWRRNDGEWVSPTFTTPEAAYHFGNHNSFLTDKEWKDYYPLPEQTSADEIKDL